MRGVSKVLFLLVLVVGVLARAEPLAFGHWPASAVQESANKRVFANSDTLIRVVQSPDKQVVSVFGVIFPQDEALVQQALSTLTQNKPVLLLTLFGGGTTHVVLGMAERVREKCPKGSCEIETLVMPGAKCASNCLTLYMMGDSRLATPTSEFGFHSASLDGKRVPGAVEGVYRGVGMSGEWLRRNNALFATTNVTYLKPEHLEDSNIVTKVLNVH